MNNYGVTLINAAKAELDKAYSPYSGFSVACALLTADGKIITGVNVENGSYGLTICAERCAVCAGVADGQRRFIAAAVVAKDAPGATPCGACRQVLSEFMPCDAPIYCVDANGEIITYTIGKLLPHPFKDASQF
jgi:cytidine deaminase